MYAERYQIRHSTVYHSRSGNRACRDGPPWRKYSRNSRAEAEKPLSKHRNWRKSPASIGRLIQLSELA